MTRLSEIGVTLSERAWARTLRMIADGIEEGLLNPSHMNIENDLRTGILTFSGRFTEVEIPMETAEDQTIADGPSAGQDPASGGPDPIIANDPGPGDDMTETAAGKPAEESPEPALEDSHEPAAESDPESDAIN